MYIFFLHGKYRYIKCGRRHKAQEVFENMHDAIWKNLYFSNTVKEHMFLHHSFISFASSLSYSPPSYFYMCNLMCSYAKCSLPNGYPQWKTLRYVLKLCNNRNGRKIWIFIKFYCCECHDIHVCKLCENTQGLRIIQ